MGAEKLSISMPEIVYEKMLRRMREREFESPSAYLQQLVREDREGQGGARISERKPPTKPSSGGKRRR